ncbi:ATP-dependent Clp protease proteolytic subunit [Methanococcus voltae]|uniref:ATP-dependent Clp protease proteolytic subunit n=1 Tax=Methanococcus voltae (strain ATCC BAA-1334 / A3) TaxID=456320 RepID=D7DSP2_METV3|nr:ATP-dependent Clp protease proteolytic subunit [Methanococcus voltae]MCS3901752.1 ATP-dependent Clp protease protease subunit [Methanococcus voltae]
MTKTFFLNGRIEEEMVDKLIKFIAENDDVAQECTLWLHSQGGGIAHSMSVINLIESSGIFKKVVCSGEVGSAALNIILSFPKDARFAYDNTVFFTHGICYENGGTVEEYSTLAKFKELYDNITNKYLKNESNDLKKWIEDNKEYNLKLNYISSNEALNMGLITNIIDNTM